MQMHMLQIDESAWLWVMWILTFVMSAFICHTWRENIIVHKLCMNPLVGLQSNFKQEWTDGVSKYKLHFMLGL